MNGGAAHGSSAGQEPPAPGGQSHNRISGGTFHGPVLQAGTVYVTPPPEVDWPVVVGDVPAAAGAFQPRAAVRERVEAARAGRGTAVLTQVLTGGGGVGKTQLAADLARDALAAGVEVLVWAPARDPLTVLRLYAEAAALVRAPGVSGTAGRTEPDARRFLAWLSGTGRRWLVVLDDVADFGPDGPLWPGSSRHGNGRVLATTRQRGAHASGGGRALVPVGAYGPAEARAYLAQRLAGAGLPHLLDDGADALAAELGRLPLALGHAAAYLVNRQLGCSAYLELFRERTRPLEGVLPPDADTERYGRPVTGALLLALDAAQRTEPRGLAAPAVRLAALLDPDGHPRALWTTAAVREHLARQRAAAAPDGADPAPEPAPATDGGGDGPERAAGRRRWWPGRRARAALPPVPPPAGPPPVSADEALAVLSVLHAYHLVSVPAAAAPHREVTVHALTARAARDTDPDGWESRLAVAFALYELWPAEEHADHRLSASLRSSTSVLEEHLGADRQYYPMFLLHGRVGISLLHAGLHAAAVAHWTGAVAGLSAGAVAEGDPEWIATRHNLAAALELAGDPERAVDVSLETARVAAERYGPDDGPTLSVLDVLGTSLLAAGRSAEAVALREHLLSRHEALFGPDDPRTLGACNNLAVAHDRSGRHDRALALWERVATGLAAEEAEKAEDAAADTPRSLTLRLNLAVTHSRQGRPEQARALGERVLAASVRLLGEDHPDTLTARAALADFHAAAGREAEAAAARAGLLADAERVLGPEHPDTLTVRGDLAVSYRRTGRTAEAVALAERVLRVRLRALGLTHPDTLLTAGNLVNCYAQQGRTGRALRLAEWVLPVKRRVLGAEHVGTVTGRHAVAVLRIRRGRTLLAADPARAAADAAAALAVLGPAAGPAVGAHELLRGAAAELLDRAREAAESPGAS
ncbi:tetratricopeptide repeat protein [Kitasatospora cineracea]|uniref:tetratricopeptide repeat protein n=1 Tax=Kitasatospora cineracea TaxID=88074 RepID=UPI0033CDD2E1